jgi:dinuclear metal center YbgI/SA1388 family protein
MAAVILRPDLTSYLDEYLACREVRDYGPNGLQVEGAPEVRRIALGVTASLALIERAAAWGADTVIVHHGLFWRGSGELRIERSLRARLRLLLAHDMNLLAYHLPLDRHLEVGNNAVFARRLGAEIEAPAFDHDGVPIGVIARWAAPVPASEFFQRIAAATGRDPLVVADGPASIARAGLVTGGAAKYVEDAARLGLDAFVTGEPSEPAVHLAREERIHFVAAGHHATERFGVQSLGAHLAERFGIDVRFIEVANPV